MTGPEPDGSELVLLTVCGDSQEAAIIRSVLESQQIACVVQGEQHRALLGMVGAYIEPRVLVAARDLEAARALLSAPPAEPEPPLLGKPGEAVEGALCAVHERRATATCTRCGAFLCDQCSVLDRTAPVCESCDDRLLPSPPERAAARRRKGLLLLALLWGPGAIGLAVLVIRELLRR
ncbi:MAG: DUF2007 domain-containing protein [Myxococcaceae bacterium]|nr:DUF2007 domain-containing protein [Myxococcaceae bacterium]